MTHYTLTRTPIEWADDGNGAGYSWNFVTGCKKISPGCRICYAETLAKRFWPKQQNGRKFTDIQIHTERLSAPLRLKKQATIFVNSMSDIFEASVPFPIVQEALHVMAVSPHLHYIILTKRADLMQQFFQLARLPDGSKWSDHPLHNVTLGVSVENDDYLHRIVRLLATPARQRIVSFEPLLGEIHARSTMLGQYNTPDVPRIEGAKIDHAIIGGESGGGAKVCNLGWIRVLINQCDSANVKVFVKQLGSNSVAYSHNHDQETRYRTKAYKGNDPAEWPMEFQRRDLIQAKKLVPYK